MDEPEKLAPLFTEERREQYRRQLRRELIERLKRQYKIPEGFEEIAADIWYDGYES